MRQEPTQPHDPSFIEYLVELRYITPIGAAKRYKCILCNKKSLEDKCYFYIDPDSRDVIMNSDRCRVSFHFSKFHRGIITLYKLGRV